MYYRGAAAAVVVYDAVTPFFRLRSSILNLFGNRYDITSEQSFARAKKWIEELRQLGSADMVIALAGNKTDLEDQRQVTPEVAKAYADEQDIFFTETSAKTADNVNELFVMIARKLPKVSTGCRSCRPIVANVPPLGVRPAGTEDWQHCHREHRIGPVQGRLLWPVRALTYALLSADQPSAILNVRVDMIWTVDQQSIIILEPCRVGGTRMSVRSSQSGGGRKVRRLSDGVCGLGFALDRGGRQPWRSVSRSRCPRTRRCS